MKVLVVSRRPHFFPLLRAADELAKYGVVLSTVQRDTPVASGDSIGHDCELLILDNSLLASRSLPMRCPLVIYQWTDQASTGTIAVLVREDVLGIIKQYRSPRQRHNEVVSFHRRALAAVGIRVRPDLISPPKAALDETALAKIHLIHGFGAWKNMDSVVGYRFGDEKRTSRDYDLHLACKVSYSAPDISAHRTMAITAVRHWADECRRRVICEAGQNLPRMCSCRRWPIAGPCSRPGAGGRPAIATMRHSTSVQYSSSLTWTTWTRTWTFTWRRRDLCGLQTGLL